MKAATAILSLLMLSTAASAQSPDLSKWMCRNLADSGGFVYQGETIFGSQACRPIPQAAPRQDAGTTTPVASASNSATRTEATSAPLPAQAPASAPKVNTFAQNAPKVYLNSTSQGNTLGAMRNQSHEMAKDFARDCPEVQITINQAEWNYQVMLNHIELGIAVRDNQIAVTDSFGNLLASKEKGSIKNAVKSACALILADWSDQAGTREKLVNGISAGFQKENVMGYAEISGGKLMVHSERASLMRFRMVLANTKMLSWLNRAGITSFAYTNDADLAFVYDVKLGQIVSPETAPASVGNLPPTR